MSKFIEKSTKKELWEFFEMDKNGIASKIMQPSLHLLLCGRKSQTEKGYKSNTGYGRIVRKNTGNFDYLELSKLYHEGRW